MNFPFSRNFYQSLARKKLVLIKEVNNETKMIITTVILMALSFVLTNYYAHIKLHNLECISDAPLLTLFGAIWSTCAQ